MHSLLWLEEGFESSQLHPVCVYLSPMPALRSLSPLPEAFLAPSSPVYRNIFLLFAHSLWFAVSMKQWAYAAWTTSAALCWPPACSVSSSPLTWRWHPVGILLGLPLLTCAHHSLCVERINDSWGCSQTFRKKGFWRKCKKASKIKNRNK